MHFWASSRDIKPSIRGTVWKERKKLFMVLKSSGNAREAEGEGEAMGDVISSWHRTG